MLLFLPLVRDKAAIVMSTPKAVHFFTEQKPKWQHHGLVLAEGVTAAKRSSKTELSHKYFYDGQCQLYRLQGFYL